MKIGKRWRNEQARLEMDEALLDSRPGSFFISSGQEKTERVGAAEDASSGSTFSPPRGPGQLRGGCLNAGLGFR